MIIKKMKKIEHNARVSKQNIKTTEKMMGERIIHCLNYVKTSIKDVHKYKVTNGSGVTVKLEDFFSFFAQYPNKSLIPKKLVTIAAQSGTVGWKTTTPVS